VNSPAQAWPQDAETRLLEGLRAHYESEGFIFKIAPEVRELPDFLGSYVPDALAQKPGFNIAIEVKRRDSSAVQHSLQKIRQLFEGHPDWQFNVVFMGADPLQRVKIPSASPAAVRARMDEVRRLNGEGHHRAAFIMAWSLLEAALHSVGGETTGKPHTPGTVVETLAMNGYIEPEIERRIRPLIDLRNRIVHGDLSGEPTSADVELVLAAVAETLATHAE
jgi:uncharacterized protein YutE (UPF0331/DUF86 family)